MLYNIHYAICGLAFAILIAVHFFSKPRLKNSHNYVFGILILVIIADAIFDILAAVTISYPGSVPLSINIALSQGYYLAQMLLAPLLYLFILSMTNLLIEKYKKLIIASFLPLAIGFIIWLGNPVTGHFFYFDSEFNYLKGPLMMALYSLGGYYLLMVAALLIVKRKVMRSNQRYSIITFMILSVVIVTIQFLIPELLITGFAASIALVMTYLTLQNPVETLDDLTGIFNRSALFQHIRENKDLDGIQHFAVIALDDFSGLVKNIGIERGNKLLVLFVDFIKKYSETSQIFRYSGDVFVAIFRNEKRQKDFIENMNRRMKFPWLLGNLEIALSSSIYYSEGIPPIRKEDRFSLIVDQMMFKGDELGKGVTVPITHQEIYEILRMHHIEESLRDALEEEKLDVYLQPIYCPQVDMFVGAEALVRFTEEKMGELQLGEFIPLAEKNGMILQIGRQVMKKVCKFADENKLYKDSGLRQISINLSVLEAVRSDLITSIERCHQENNIPYGFIGFEITETNSSLGGDLFIKNMLELVDKGFSFALDDFGTGYSNLDSVIALPFHSVKLDRALLVAGQENEKMYIILAEHIKMFKRMGLRVVVEGVETLEHVSLIKDLPLDLIQGFYYSKPMPMEAAANFIREYNKGKSEDEPN